MCRVASLSAVGGVLCQGRREWLASNAVCDVLFRGYARFFLCWVSQVTRFWARGGGVFGARFQA